MSLKKYAKKRDFRVTPEPKAKILKGKAATYVIQKHHARSLHYDFRLSIGGVLKSWAVPKGMPKTTKDKRLAVQTEDHPLAYANFEGEIPEGEYGAGKVIIWDKGKYYNLKEGISIASSHKKGRIEIWLMGERYEGPYALVRFREKNWLLIKMKKSKFKK